jgi:hypothetical protein
MTCCHCWVLPRLIAAHPSPPRKGASRHSCAWLTARIGRTLSSAGAGCAQNPRARFHYLSTPFERIAAAIGGLCLVADSVSQTVLDNLPRKRRHVAGPITECRPKAMNGDTGLIAEDLTPGEVRLLCAGKMTLGQLRQPPRFSRGICASVRVALGVAGAYLGEAF